jgi:hypothetical protein
MTSRWLLVAMVTLLLAGCASGFQNTLAQDRTWSASRVCQAEIGSNIVIQRVDPDGHWHGRCSDRCTRETEFKSCMSEEIRAYLEESTLRQRATTGATALSTSQGRTAITEPIIKPEWNVGSEWAYRSESPSGSQTFVWRLDRIENLANEPHYVIRAGSREIFYRVADRGYTKEIFYGKTVREVSPSGSWRWVTFPLQVGLSWDMKYVESRPTEQQTRTIERRCVAEAEEALTVPAGTFATIRIVCKNSQTGAWVSTQWYSPEVTHIVKDEFSLRTGGRTSRELLMFRLK